MSGLHIGWVKPITLSMMYACNRSGTERVFAVVCFYDKMCYMFIIHCVAMVSFHLVELCVMVDPENQCGLCGDVKRRRGSV